MVATVVKPLLPLRFRAYIVGLIQESFLGKPRLVESSIAYLNRDVCIDYLVTVKFHLTKAVVIQ